LTPEIRAYLRLRPKPPKGAELLFPTAPGAVFSAAVNAKVPIFFASFCPKPKLFLLFAFAPYEPFNPCAQKRAFKRVKNKRFLK
jgi:hypothetical protein